MARHKPKVELTYNFHRHTRYRNTLWHTLLDLRSLYLSFTCISRLRHSYSNNRLSPPARTPTKFIACVRRPESAKRIRNALSEYPQTVTILQNENVKGVEAADVVILGCKPQMVNDILSANGIRDALAGKLLISICAGVPVTQIEDVLYQSHKTPNQRSPLTPVVSCESCQTLRLYFENQ